MISGSSWYITSNGKLCQGCFQEFVMWTQGMQLHSGLLKSTWSMPPFATGQEVCYKVLSHVEVSWNRGTSKSSILIGVSIINHPLWGIPIYGNLHETEFCCKSDSFIAYQCGLIAHKHPCEPFFWSKWGVSVSEWARRNEVFAWNK